MTRKLQPWMLVSAAWIVPAILGAIDVVAQSRIWGDGPVNIGRVLFTSIDWFLYAGLTPFVFMLSRRFPLARPIHGRRIALHLAFSLLFCVAWASGGTLLRIAMTSGPLDGGVSKNFWSWVFITLPFGVAVYLAMVGTEHAIRWFAEARERERQVAKLSEQLAGARLAALQAQLNPHFLFNSLNTIAVLVRDREPDAATRVIEQLSDVLRTTLGRRDNETSLEDELALVRQYLSVESARFSDRLRPVLEVDPATLGATIPSFAVQHLVENAVRHGIARRTGSGLVTVRARREGDALVIEVEDDGAGLDAGANDVAGHGLANTRERLRTLYGDAATLHVAATGNGARATLRVPWREMAHDVGGGGDAR